jgi:hypothetical protein
MTRKLTIDIGARFGKWVVIGIANSDNNGKTCWVCRCDCGVEKHVMASHLKNNSSRQCRICRNTNKRRTKRSLDMEILIKDLYMSGESTTSLSNKFDILPATIRNIIKRRGGKMRDMAEVGTRARKDPGVSARNLTFKHNKAEAKYRGIVWDLDKDEYFRLNKENCHYCGTQPSNIKKTSNGNYYWSGIDRVDPSKGYVLNNVVPCCKICNRAKSDLSYENFLQWVHRLSFHNRTINQQEQFSEA